MKIDSTRVIVLRRVNYGESDRIITLLTSDFGKVKVIVKGVRKQKSKLAGGIELFSVSEVQYLKGRRDIGVLTSSRLIKHYSDIVKDLRRTELAYHMLERIDKITEDHSGSEYFNILDESMEALSRSSLYIDFIRINFEMRTLQLFGGLPDFTLDKYGSKIDQGQRFRFDNASMLFEESTKGLFDKNHIKILKLLAHNGPADLSRVGGMRAYCEDLKAVADNIIASHYNF